MGIGGKISKPFFVTAIAAVLVFFAFSYSELLPEAEAYVYKKSPDPRPAFDYYVYNYAYIDQARYGWMRMPCNDGDQVVGTQLYSPRTTGWAYSGIGYAYSGINADGNYVIEKVAYGYVYNDTTLRTYFYVWAFCNYG